MFESLEPRQFLSVAPGFSISKGRTLYIRGTEAADRIFVSNPVDSDDLIISVNDVVLGEWVSSGAFRKVRVDAGGGDDSVDLTFVRRSAEVFAGAGNDTVIAPGGKDGLFASRGGGASTLWGGDGNDSLVGGDQNDTLFGEDGDDTLFGDRGFDTLYGGPGTDSWRPSRGSDFEAELETRQDLGATVIHDDLDLSQLHYKVTRQNGHTILRLTVTFTPELGYDVSFGFLSPFDTVGIPGVITVDYTRLIDRPERLPVGRPFITATRRAYYDLGAASPVDYTINIQHPSGSLITTLKFRA